MQNPTLIPNLTGIVLSVAERQMGPINGGPINLAAARLRHAFLRFATLSEANLEWADLSDADLREARLNGASLVGADFSDALLDHADFAGANLFRANLCAASLHGARNLTQEQIEQATGDAHTVLPPDLKRPPVWTNNQLEMQPPASFGRRMAEPDPRDIVPPEGRRVSWLVGGPRSAGGSASISAITPLRNPRSV